MAGGVNSESDLGRSLSGWVCAQPQGAAREELKWVVGLSACLNSEFNYNILMVRCFMLLMMGMERWGPARGHNAKRPERRPLGLGSQLAAELLGLSRGRSRS